MSHRFALCQAVAGIEGKHLETKSFPKNICWLRGKNRPQQNEQRSVMRAGFVPVQMGPGRSEAQTPLAGPPGWEVLFSACKTLRAQ